MKKTKTLLLLLFVAISGAAYAQQDSVMLKISTDEMYNYLQFKNKHQSTLAEGGLTKQAFEAESKYAFLEKGVSFGSFSIGVIGNNMDEFLLEPLAEVESLYNRNASFSLSGGYFIANNTAVSARFSYAFSDTRVKINADILDLLISAQSYEANSAKSTYSASVGIRNYVPLDAGHRFFLINETGLGYHYVDGLSKNIYDDGVKTTKIKSDKNRISLGLSPGFMYFMSRGFAFEFLMNPIVAYWETTSTTNNEVSEGRVDNYGLSFKFIPFNIQIGFSYYFGLDFEKNKNYLRSINLY